MRTFSKLLTTALLFSPLTLVNAVNKFTIECDNRLRKATHCANGSLYGLIENVPPEKDYDRLVDAIHPFVFRNPARGRNGNQHPFGEAIPVARRLSKTPGAVVSVDLADMLPYWPYKWPGMNKWLDEVRSFIRDKKASGLTNWYGLEIWNEAENTWRDSNGHTFNEMWKMTYDVIREMDPDEKIIGPCDGLYSEQRLTSFFNYCKQHDCLPDIMCWHELSGLDNISKNFKAYRALEKKLGIPELPITINEYCDPNHDYEGQPGSDARFFGKFERYKIDSGLISWWFVPKPGRLGSLLATDNQPGAGWFFHKWYGDMTGDMLYVKPPNDNSKLVDGAACLDDEQEYISFLFGGPNDGTINVQFVDLPEFLGDIAKVKLEKVDWVSKDTISNGPNTVWEKEYDISNGFLSVTVTGCNATTGYRMYITKGTGNGRVEPPSEPTVSAIAEGTYKLINRNSGKALTVINDSTNNDASVVQYTDTGKKSQQWVISEDGGYRLLNVNANKCLDISNNSQKDGGNAIIWPDNGNANQRWEIEKADGDYYILINQNSGKVLDVENNSQADNGNVIQWSLNNKANQQWKLVPVGELKPRTTTTRKPKTTTTTKAPEPTNETSPCSEAIKKQGYKCCSKNCSIIFTDDDGTWGVENDEWCGCGASNDSATCPYAIAEQGYKCCSASNCNVVTTDESGKWGIENDEWCGISDKC